MAKSIKVKIIQNKSNGQFNFSLPKKKLTNQMLIDLAKSKEMKINLEEFYS